MKFCSSLYRRTRCGCRGGREAIEVPEGHIRSSPARGRGGRHRQAEAKRART